MAWVRVNWELVIRDRNERSSDNPGLHLALVRILDGTVEIHAHRTGYLAPEGYRAEGTYTVSSWRGAVRSRPVPTPENPYIGLVVRAIEHDESSLANRRDDYDDFVEAIRGKSQDSVDSGAVPSAEVLWAAGNSVALRDRTLKDDDDRIGVSARAYPDYGNEIAFDLAREDSFEPNGGYIWATSRPLDLRFLEEGAHYHLTGDLRVVTDDPAPSSP